MPASLGADGFGEPALEFLDLLAGLDEGGFEAGDFGGDLGFPRVRGGRLRGECPGEPGPFPGKTPGDAAMPRRTTSPLRGLGTARVLHSRAGTA
jgi:hypothetical protein